MNYTTQIWKTMTVLAAMLFLPNTTYAQNKTASSPLQSKQDTVTFAQRFIQQMRIEGGLGHIFPTNSFLKGENSLQKQIKTSYSGHLKYAFQFRPNTAEAKIHINAYQGLGIGYFNFENPQEVGNPIAFYLFQGGRIARLSTRLSLNYEWSFGISFGWKPYDVLKNPSNKIVGSKANAYLNTNIHLNWAISPTLDLIAGVAGAHFSNGNTRYPNSGLNTIDAKIGLVYNFNRKTEELTKSWQRPIIPSFAPYISYDLTLFGSWRKKAVDVNSGQIAAPDTYTVLGFNFAPMYNLGHKYRAGISLDGVYDASSNIRTIDNNPSLFTNPSIGKQLSLGVSARGEFVMPYFTVGIGLGANILHGGGDTKSFYQILALKIDVTRNSFLHIGYNLKDFHEPNYLMLGIGYRFNNKRNR